MIGKDERVISRPERILMVAHRIDDSGGMERVHAELVRRLLDRYQFTVISNGLAEDLRDRVDWRRVWAPSRPVPLRVLVFYILGGLRLRRVAGKCLVHTCGAVVPNRADIVSVHFCHAGFVASERRLAPSGVSLDRRLNTSLQRLLALAAERWSFQARRLHVLAPVSAQVADELRAAYSHVDIREVPNGVDTERFRPDSTVRAAARAQHGIPDTALVVLFVGGDWHRKGLALAVDALAVTRQQVTDVQLWVVGEGDERYFAARAAAAGVGNAVRFFGRRDDVERFYQAADLYVCSSGYEPFSLSLLEAASSGLPLVTTQVGVAGELIDGAEDAPGVVVPRSASAVGLAVAEFAADPERRARCGKAARQRAQTFAWDRVVREIDDIYRSLARADVP